MASERAAKGFHVFVPKLETWSRRAGRQHLIFMPMFPSYLFLHHAMDELSYIEVRKGRGLMRILGERWDRLGIIPDAEIEATQRGAAARVSMLPHPCLKEGQRVRITHGLLAGTESILVHSKPAVGLSIVPLSSSRRGAVKDGYRPERIPR